MCVVSASAGASYVLAGTLLVNLYACLFLGLMFYRAAVISVFLVGSYLVMGIAMQLMSQELFYSAAMLGTAAVIGMIATYNLEHAIRKSFLERNLLFELAERDGLTGLYNRRIFDNFMRRLWRQSRREETAIEIVLIDIDYFKVYNDLYGHQVGDDTLKKVAQCISKRAKRPFDFCARYGGEEFVLVLYGPPADYAKSVPEQIRQDVLDMAIAHEGSGVGVTVTVSVGVAIARPGSGRSLTGAIQAADEALYLAKKQGRNRVVSMDASISEVETGKFRTAFEELA
jgi:diguanylate cyclase (GGDEF)-like protein